MWLRKLLLSLCPRTSRPAHPCAWIVASSCPSVGPASPVPSLHMSSCAYSGRTCHGKDKGEEDGEVWEEGEKARITGEGKVKISCSSTPFSLPGLSVPLGSAFILQLLTGTSPSPLPFCVGTSSLVPFSVHGSCHQWLAASSLCSYSQAWIAAVRRREAGGWRLDWRRLHV